MSRCPVCPRYYYSVNDLSYCRGCDVLLGEKPTESRKSPRDRTGREKKPGASPEFCKCGEPLKKKNELRQACCRLCQNVRQTDWSKKYPWAQRLRGIRTRCRNPNVKAYRWYGAKGVKCLLTEANIKTLWDRDRAAMMSRPSIDRIDPAGNYEMSNCRFIELSENSRRAAIGRSQGVKTI